MIAGCEPTVHHPFVVSLSKCGKIIKLSGLKGVEENGVVVTFECKYFKKRFVRFSSVRGFPQCATGPAEALLCSAELPQRSVSPYAGLLKSPKRPFGKSSQSATLLISPLLVSFSGAGAVVSSLVARSAAACGVTLRSGGTASALSCAEAHVRTRCQPWNARD